jgi:hypothetical protein
MRAQFAVTAVLADPDRLEHLDVATGRGQRLDADLVDRSDKRRGAAVHDRNFGAVHLDHGVVDAERIQGRQHVLSGRYRRSRVIAENGGEFGRRHRTEIGRKFAICLAAGAAAQKYDSGVRLRRVQGQGDRRAGMNANSGKSDLLAKRRLPAGVRAPRHAHILHLMAKLRAVGPTPPEGK